MTRIFVCSAGDGEARRHLEDSVRRPAALAEIEERAGGFYDVAAALAGSKVEASVALGRRSLLQRLLDRGATVDAPEDVPVLGESAGGS